MAGKMRRERKNGQVMDERMPHARFRLVLMVTHDCNLRCTYCYAGEKVGSTMDGRIGRKAIDCAIASLVPGGLLELGFFGGEPLLEAELVESLIGHARHRAANKGMRLSLGMTTNGTQTGAVTWRVMTLPDMHLAVSHDGLPAIHDRHRRSAAGPGTSDRVLQAIDRLTKEGKEFRVVMVVRPDTVEHLPEGIAFLRAAGVRHVEPSLDLWTTWVPEDVRNLERAVVLCANLWRAGLPDFGVSWFDEKAALLCDTSAGDAARCGFGDGESAVAPSGRLYPCERLIGNDAEENPMRLPGHAGGARAFGSSAPAPCRCAEPCGRCEIRSYCNTTCRCSNHVRTGHVEMPDGLLCAWNRVCVRETARVLNELHSRPALAQT